MSPRRQLVFVLLLAACAGKRAAPVPDAAPADAPARSSVEAGASEAHAVETGAADVTVADTVAHDMGLADVPARDGPALASPDAGAADRQADARPDGAPAPDGPAECTQPSDCEGRPRPPVHGACSGGWSCLQRRCTFECGAGRTCALDVQDCIVCSTGPRGCPGTRCYVQRPTRVESTNCPSVPPPAFTATACSGAWTRLPDGTLCSIESLPTGAVRWAVSCGSCAYVLVE